MDGAEERLMTFAAPRSGRIIWPSGVLLATLMVVLAVVQLTRGEAGWFVWFQLIVNVCWGVAFAWLSYLTFFVPSVRIDRRQLLLPVPAKVIVADHCQWDRRERSARNRDARQLTQVYS